MHRPTHITYHKAMLIALIVGCFASLGSIIYLDEHFYRARPRQPEPQAGRIYPVSIHGGIRIYLTRTEKLPFDYWLYPFLIFATGATLLDRRWKIFRNPHDDIPKKLY